MKETVTVKIKRVDDEERTIIFDNVIIVGETPTEDNKNSSVIAMHGTLQSMVNNVSRCFTNHDTDELYAVLKMSLEMFQTLNPKKREEKEKRFDEIKMMVAKEALLDLLGDIKKGKLKAVPGESNESEPPSSEVDRIIEEARREVMEEAKKNRQ